MGPTARATLQSFETSPRPVRPLTWFAWEHQDEALLEFTRRVIALRRAHPTFMRRRWFQGRPLHGAGVEDIAWLTPRDTPMTDEDWSVGFAKGLMIFLNGAAIAGRGPRGERIEDDSFLLLFNAHTAPVEFVLSCVGGPRLWFAEVDTTSPLPPARPPVRSGQRITIDARAMCVLADRDVRAQPRKRTPRS